MARPTLPRTGVRNDRRGAPHGNTNAERHGIYAHHFTPSELDRIISQLDGEEGGLASTIAATHVILDRILSRMDNETDTHTWITLTRAWSDVSGRLASLIRTHHVISGDAGDTIAAAISAALDQVAAALEAQI